MMQDELQLVLEKEESQRYPLIYFQMDDLFEKLKLINYENILREMKMKWILNKLYFVKSTNPGEQFFIFISLCAWLMRKLGKSFKQPEEFDDPIQIIEDVSKNLQEVDIPTNFPLTKLIQGSGSICVYVLDSLVTQVLSISKHSIPSLCINQEGKDLPNYGESDTDMVLETYEAKFSDIITDDSKVRNLNMDNVNQSMNEIEDLEETYYTKKEHWRLELEKIIPKLKVVVNTDTRGWESCFKQMEKHNNSIKNSVKAIISPLTTLKNDVGYHMVKLENRDKYLNTEFQTQAKRIREILFDITTTADAVVKAQKEGQIAEKNLLEIINVNSIIKIKMEQKGSSISDASVVSTIKKYISKVKEEIDQINLEIVLLLHSSDTDISRQGSSYS